MNKKGFTIVELIVVIAIMGVALGVGGYSLAYINSIRATECAESMNRGIELTKTASMTMAGDQTVTFYTGTDGIYMKQSWTSEPELIGTSRLTVTYSYVRTAGSAAVMTTLGAAGTTDALTIGFNKGSGSVKTPSIASGNMTITIAGSKTYTITLYRLTGETVLEH